LDWLLAEPEDAFPEEVPPLDVFDATPPPDGFAFLEVTPPPDAFGEAEQFSSVSSS